MAAAALALLLATHTTLALWSLPGQGPPALVEPASGSSTILAHPHFAWSAPAGCSPDAVLGGDARACAAYRVQLAADAAFASVLRDERLDAVITRYVPLDALPLGELWWRVAAVVGGGSAGGGGGGGVRGPWSAPATLTVAPVPAARVLRVAREGATWDSVRAAVAAAAALAPGVRLEFESGDWQLAPPAPVRPGSKGYDYGVFLELSGVSDVIIDGGGARVSFGGGGGGFPSFVRLTSCERVLIANFSLDIADPLPYTALTVSAVGGGGADLPSSNGSSSSSSSSSSAPYYFEGALVAGHPTMEVLVAGMGGLLRNIAKPTYKSVFVFTVQL
jgi:hypothetical protein